jgi:hypothetical protein
MKVLKKIAFKDFTFSIEDTGKEVRILFNFTQSAISRNKKLIETVSRYLSPNENIIPNADETGLYIMKLSKQMFYNHYLYQLVVMHEKKIVNLDFSHVEPLNHSNSIGDIKSGKISQDRKKRIEVFESGSSRSYL